MGWVRRHGLLPAVCLLALAVSSYRLSSWPYWQDDGATLSATGRTWGQLFSLLRHQDLVFTLYYSVIHVLREISSDPSFLRSTSVLGTVVLVGATVPIATRLGASRPVAGLAAVLCALDPFLAEFTRQVRPYTLTAAAAALTLLAALRLREQPTPRRILAWAVAGVLALLLHAFVGAAFPLSALWLLWACRRERRVRAVASGGLLLSLAWLAAITTQRGQVGYLLHEPFTYELHLTTSILGGDVRAAVVAPFILLGAVWCLRGSGANPDRLLLVGAMVLAPLVLLAGRVVHPVYEPRYLLEILPMLTTCAALGVAAAGRWVARSGPPAVAVSAAPALALVLVAGAVQSGLATIRMPYYRDNPVVIADVLTRDARPGDLLVYQGAITRTYLSLYLSPALRSEVPDLLSAESPAATGSFEGTLRPLDEVSAQLRSAPTVWVISLGPPDDDYESDTLALLGENHTAHVEAVGGELQLTAYTAG